MIYCSHSNERYRSSSSNYRTFCRSLSKLIEDATKQDALIDSIVFLSVLLSLSLSTQLHRFLFSPLIDYLVKTYEWRGTMMVLSGIVLCCSLFGALFRPLKSNANENTANEEPNTCMSLTISIRSQPFPPIPCVSEQTIIQLNCSAPFQIKPMWNHRMAASKMAMQTEIPNHTVLPHHVYQALMSLPNRQPMVKSFDRTV